MLAEFVGKKVPVLVKPNYIGWFEYSMYDGVPVIFGHIDVFVWNKSTYVDLLPDIHRLLSIQCMPILLTHTPDDKKHLKFITMLDFTPLNREIVDSKGNTKQLYIWKGSL